MTMMMMMMMMMMMIIVLKVTIPEFYILLTAPRTVSNTYAHVAKEPSYANHVQHIECVSYAACPEPRGTKGQLSCKV